MNDWQSLKNIFFMLVLLGFSLLMILSLAATGRASLLIPSPENTAESLVVALSARRYSGAFQALSQDLQEQVGMQDLQKINRAVQSSHGGILDARGQESQEQGTFASATVQVKLGDLRETSLDLPLVKENGEWKVSSIEPLQELASDSLP